jgi:WD40 repeat protein
MDEGDSVMMSVSAASAAGEGDEDVGMSSLGDYLLPEPGLPKCMEWCSRCDLCAVVSATGKLSVHRLAFDQQVAFDALLDVNEHSSDVSSVAWNPTQFAHSLLAVGFEDGSIMIVDVEDNRIASESSSAVASKGALSSLLSTKNRSEVIWGNLNSAVSNSADQSQYWNHVIESRHDREVVALKWIESSCRDNAVLLFTIDIGGKICIWTRFGICIAEFEGNAMQETQIDLCVSKDFEIFTAFDSDGSICLQGSLSRLIERFQEIDFIGEKLAFSRTETDSALKAVRSCISKWQAIQADISRKVRDADA